MLKSKKIKEGIYWVGAVDWDRELFDALIPLPEGTSYNAYLVEGSEKTVLVDTVDPAKTDVLFSHLQGCERIDFIISHHAEQDHSGAIPAVLERYPEAKVITSVKGEGLLMSHLKIPKERIVTVEDGDKLDLGGRTLEFIYTPWVHWPETMVSYLHEDKILFSCDLFGSHIATSSLYSSKLEKVTEAVKRYYAEVMMPFRTIIKKNLEKLDNYDIEVVCPSHGLVHNDPSFVIDAHRSWVSADLKNTVVLPYVSMHGSTLRMVDYLTDALCEEGIKVERFDLTVTDMGSFAMSLVDAATIVVASPTFLTGAHPLVVSAAFLANGLRPKLKFGAVIGSFGWASNLEKQIGGLLAGLKLEMSDPVLVKGYPSDEDLVALDTLARGITQKHRDAGIVD